MRHSDEVRVPHLQFSVFVQIDCCLSVSPFVVFVNVFIFLYYKYDLSIMSVYILPFWCLSDPDFID
jgi:hypothetical protein